MPTNPAIAIGIFSWSVILSVLVEKNSSGSFSRVNFLRSGSIPRPSLRMMAVRGEDLWVRELVAVGAKAVAVARKRRERKVRNMILVIVKPRSCSMVYAKSV